MRCWSKEEEEEEKNDDEEEVDHCGRKRRQCSE
jgi:hypothetical protein